MDAGNPVYQGNCHCGRYRFELSVPEIERAISCRCSLCLKKGYIWFVVPVVGSENSQFRVVRDDGFLREYQSAALRDKVRLIETEAQITAIRVLRRRAAAASSL